MSVINALAFLMQNHPMIYYSRADTLLELFSSNHDIWKDGEIYIKFEAINDAPIPYCEEEIMESYSDAIDGVIQMSQHIHRLRCNNHAKFVIDNAYLLAQDTNSPLTAGEVVNFSGRNLFNMPEDVQQDWKDAAIEICHTILNHEYRDTSVSSIVRQTMREQFEKSKRVCRTYLESISSIEVSRCDREQRLLKLRQEAAALGVTIVEK